VGDLEIDTAVVASGDGRYRAALSEDWAIWGPNGGYLASVALRAAGAAAGRARPASIMAHFLGVAEFREVDLTVEELRGSRSATSLRVSMRQDGRPVLDALVWALDTPPVELTHDHAPMPDVPPPDDLPSFAERMATQGLDSPFPFWANIEHRPIAWRDGWPPPGPLEPAESWWCRFRPTAVFEDPWVDACRALIPLDTMGWPTASRAHAYRQPEVIAPTIDLSVRFHRPAARGEWLLCRTESPVGSGGLLAATGQAWSRDGALVASAGQTMLCRPAPPGPG
jgi:acyl-CoA thioesterase II